MRYVKAGDFDRANRIVGGALDTCGNIDVTGSVRGMQNRFGWKPCGQVRCGGYVYNIGPKNVAKLRHGPVMLRGE